MTEHEIDALKPGEHTDELVHAVIRRFREDRDQIIVDMPHKPSLSSDAAFAAGDAVELFNFDESGERYTLYWSTKLFVERMYNRWAVCVWRNSLNGDHRVGCAMQPHSSVSMLSDDESLPMAICKALLKWNITNTP